MIGMPGTSYRGELPVADERLVSLADELRQDVTHLAVDIGERNVQNHPHQLAQAAYCIETKFAAAGFPVKCQEYGVSGCDCCNLEVEILGASRPEEIVIVGAHYDTVPGTPGANDNTSGVAATLALSRRFAIGGA
jgi:acetylornithine deacetylase/succinyl-diaminopimelate desuccinylase-like protein